ncbi:MAG: hypothetical protein IT340_07955 [Chloroflexi bacterium]|nr:hypothetical protein [Chloroflexota bacterium]
MTARPTVLLLGFVAASDAAPDVLAPSSGSVPLLSQPTTTSQQTAPRRLLPAR